MFRLLLYVYSIVRSISVVVNWQVEVSESEIVISPIPADAPKGKTKPNRDTQHATTVPPFSLLVLRYEY